MKRKIICILSICALMFIVSGCKVMEKKKEPILFSVPEYVPNTYPITVKVHYSVSDNFLYMTGKNKNIVLKFFSKGFDYAWKIYPVKSMKNGYKIMDKENEEFTMKEPENFGYSPIIRLTKQNGSFQMTFNSKDEYEAMLSGIVKDYSATYFKK